MVAGHRASVTGLTQYAATVARRESDKVVFGFSKNARPVLARSLAIARLHVVLLPSMPARQSCVSFVRSSAQTAFSHMFPTPQTFDKCMGTKKNNAAQ